MTSYQEIEFRDLKMRVLCAADIQAHLKQNEPFSLNGHKSKGEGEDFVFENKNKRLRKMIPAGVLTERRWIRVHGCFDSLNEVGFINAVNLIVLCLYACN